MNSLDNSKEHVMRSFPRGEEKGNYPTLSVTLALPHLQSQGRYYKQSTSRYLPEQPYKCQGKRKQSESEVPATILQHNQVRILPGIQVCFNILKSINLRLYINRMKIKYDHMNSCRIRI